MRKIEEIYEDVISEATITKGKSYKVVKGFMAENNLAPGSTELRRGDVVTVYELEKNKHYNIVRFHIDKTEFLDTFNTNDWLVDLLVFIKSVK